MITVSALQIVQVAALGLGGLMTLVALWQLCRKNVSLVRPMAVFAGLTTLAVAYFSLGSYLLLSL